jgi:4-alpha-glucanotransferase
MSSAPAQSAVPAALSALDVRELALAVHDASLPMGAHEDLGRGSPGSDEAARLFAFARRLGFTAIQLGPQGETSAGNASPYDSTAFSRSLVSLAWAPLVRGEGGAKPFDEETLAALVAAQPGEPEPARHEVVHALQQRALAAAHAGFQAALAAPGEAGAAARAQAGRLAAFAEREAFWLERYALYEALAELHGCDHRSGWPADGPDRRLWEPAQAAVAGERAAALRWAHAERIERYRFGQLLAHEQHERVRARAAALGLRLLGDLQIGVADRDRWAWPDAFLAGYWLGAPPSRTNPEGQPWGHPVLDPTRFGEGGPASAFLARRAGKLFAEFDGLRIDHPHGLVDPWVYRSDDPDPLHAVQHGARLFGAPDLSDHPALAGFAIASRGDLSPDPRTPRWAEDWVVRLSEAQLDRYAVAFDALLETARRAGRREQDVACEVLSTLPYPLARVLARHGLGRFRVTQKADPADPRDVYRSEHAAPEDWVMIGTHDTPPIWLRVEEWLRDGSAPARARRLAERLAPAERERAPLADALARDPGLLAQAHLAELFASRARHVLVFFTDLFGIAEVYNAPGTVSDANWSLRLPASWQGDYAQRLAGGRALSLPRALALALRARGSGAHAGLIARLESEALAAPRALRAG